MRNLTPPVNTLKKETVKKHLFNSLKRTQVKKEDSFYDPVFVEKILNAEKNIHAGNYKEFELKDFLKMLEI